MLINTCRHIVSRLIIVEKSYDHVVSCLIIVRKSYCHIGSCVIMVGNIRRLYVPPHRFPSDGGRKYMRACSHNRRRQCNDINMESGIEFMLLRNTNYRTTEHIQIITRTRTEHKITSEHRQITQIIRTTDHMQITDLKICTLAVFTSQ